MVANMGGEDAVEASLPVRGAWIEIIPPVKSIVFSDSRSPCGERGLKCAVALRDEVVFSRSPCGERGLKSPDGHGDGRRGHVAPRAGSVD